MKKFNLLTAFLLSASHAFSAVITPATGGSDISADSALSPAWTTLGPIVLDEGSGNPQRGHFQQGTNVTLVLKAPTGFQFNTAVTPNVNFTAGKDISSASVAVNDPSTLTLTVTIISANNSDRITIGGTTRLQVRATSGAADSIRRRFKSAFCSA